MNLICDEYKVLSRGLLLQVPADEHLARVYEMWCWYYDEAGAFDRRVCTGPMHRGAIMPATPEEGRLIREHARALFAEVGEYAHRYVAAGLVRPKDLVHARHQARDRVRR